MTRKAIAELHQTHPSHGCGSAAAQSPHLERQEKKRKKTKRKRKKREGRAHRELLAGMSIHSNHPGRDAIVPHTSRVSGKPPYSFGKSSQAVFPASLCGSAATRRGVHGMECASSNVRSSRALTREAWITTMSSLASLSLRDPTICPSPLTRPFSNLDHLGPTEYRVGIAACSGVAWRRGCFLELQRRPSAAQIHVDVVHSASLHRFRTISGNGISTQFPYRATYSDRHRDLADGLSQGLTVSVYRRSIVRMALRQRQGLSPSLLCKHNDRPVVLAGRGKRLSNYPERRIPQGLNCGGHIWRRCVRCNALFASAGNSAMTLARGLQGCSLVWAIRHKMRRGSLVLNAGARECGASAFSHTVSESSS